MPRRPKVRLVYQDLELIRSIILGTDTDTDDEATEQLLLKKIDIIMSKMSRKYRQANNEPNRV
jgi:hypothetical protein